mmetsp:Transcript_3133/g.2654  ORF Transcript_3133/g.2654 Transcript_3133/m.2654 type:complete len:829 (-) Transcript_3133:1383-3869(-)
MSYSPSTLSDDNKPPPDPRYHEWDTRSRQELKERLYEAVDKRREATEELIPRVLNEQLHILGVNNIERMGEENNKIYRVSDENVMTLTHKAIDTQIQEWKGLRWWRFNENNACDTWNKWFKKAKCWQDQNQHKPLGRFWCLIFDELKQYTLNVANNKFSNNPRYKQALQNCLFAKCVEAILKGAVRFERTRETPLLPVRALTQSKELQQKLNAIDNGFTLSVWKQQAEAEHKRQKQQLRQSNRNGNRTGEKGQRANVATILNERCGKHATNVYQRYVRSLAQIIPSLNIDMSAIESAMEQNHNPYSSNSDYHPVTSYNDNKKNIMSNNNSRSRYQYIPDNHNNHNNHGHNAQHRPTPAVFASLPNNMDMEANTHHSRHHSHNQHQRGYGPSRGISNNIQRAESHRYSPTLSSNSISDTSSLSNDDAVSSVSVGTSHSSSMASNLSNFSANNHRSYRPPSNVVNNNNSMPTKPPAPRTRTVSMANMNISNVGSSSGHQSSTQLDRLSHENEQLKAQLADIRRQLRDRSHSTQQESALNAIVQQMQLQNQWSQVMMAQNMKFMTPPHIPSPMSVPVSSVSMGMPPIPPPPPIPVRPSMIPPGLPTGLPTSIPFNDRNGGHGIYTPQDGKMFLFPSKDYMNGNGVNGVNGSNKNKNKSSNRNRNRNELDLDQIVNNKQMNLDITMSSSSSSDDSSTSNDSNNSDKTMNKDTRMASSSPASASSSAQQPGIYDAHNHYSFPDCFCDVSPPSDPSDIYHSEGTPDISITPQTTSGSSAWDTETQFPSTFRDNNTFIGNVGGIASSIPPPTYPPNHGYNHFDDISVYGEHPTHI